MCPTLTSPSPEQVFVVIAAYNEAKSIGEVLSRLHPRWPNIVVVDDGSQDDTANIAAANAATVIRHPVNLGQGAAIQTGMRFALSRDAQYIVTFDADGQHVAGDIETLLEYQRRHGTKVVLGSRFLGSTVGMPYAKRVLLKAAVFFTRLSTGLQLTDAHNGLRLFVHSAAAALRIRQNRMAHASEILEQISMLKLTYVEAPVTVVYTEYSKAKGQRMTNTISILLELFMGRLIK
ncbi:MAG: glycosyltransferase family 2 protein [Alphaproteobacteria bacterium]|nr:glycosyltransferase family 2 protein [Alphaproteobacteria bacterium]